MMKWQSFRLRIAVLSAALAGSAIVGFAAVSWFQIYTAKISRLDAELLNQLVRAIRVRERERWDLYGDSLTYSFGTNTKTPIALLVLDGSGNTLYQTNASPGDPAVGGLLTRRLQLVPLPPPRAEPPPLPPRSELSSDPSRSASRPVPPDRNSPRREQQPETGVLESRGFLMWG